MMHKAEFPSTLIIFPEENHSMKFLKFIHFKYNSTKFMSHAKESIEYWCKTIVVKKSNIDSVL